jgi:hypothetical protein
LTCQCNSGSKISRQNGRTHNETRAVTDLEVTNKQLHHVSVRSPFTFLFQGTFVNTGDSPPPPPPDTHHDACNSSRHQSKSRVTPTACIKVNEMPTLFCPIFSAVTVRPHYVLMFGGAAGVLRRQSVCFNVGNVCTLPAERYSQSTATTCHILAIDCVL